MSNEKKRRLSRREFLIALGVAGGGLLLGVKVGLPYGRIRLAELLDSGGGPPVSLDAEANAWFRINPENQVTLYLPKSEMGQGVHTALAQIAAEELEIAWEQLRVIHASTGQGLDDSSGTGASNTVSSLYQPLRVAAATMREMLRSEAARLLGASPTVLIAKDGYFLASGSNGSISYGQIVSQTASWQIPEETPTLKEPQAFKLVGKSKDRVDLKDKILGQALFGYDIRLEGMLYGAVLRPRSIAAKVRQVSPGEAAQRPGVVKILIEDDFAGVVAHTRAQAYSALNALQVEWDEGKAWQQAEIEELMQVGNGKGVTIQKEGQLNRDLNNQEAYAAEYRTPLAHHAHLEPQTATADVQPDQIRIWTSTQFPVRERELVAKALGRDENQIVIIPAYLGGGFGRRLGGEAAVEAARLSAAVGKPVQVAWNRSEEFLNGYLRPPTHHRLRAALAADGTIHAMEHQQASGAVAFPFLPGILKAVMGADFGSWRGAMIQYAVPNKETTAWLVDLPIATGWWRGLGLLANTFAIESFIDELAHRAGQDPLAFRLTHLPNDEMGQRMRKVLEAAADSSGWGQNHDQGRALGIACSTDVGTVVAQVAEVSLEDGQIRVHKITAVVDPGLVVNPDGATAQVEGAINMGLSSTLLEEATLADGKLAAENFNRYPLLTIQQAPEIETILLESGYEPKGMGEPPIGPVAAAVANAYFALSGERLRKLPLQPGKVL